MTKRKAIGFTLIELLVVIAIIAMLAAILVPAVNKALLSAAMTQTVANGSNIYKSQFADQMDQVVLGSAYSSFPSNEATSTAYFNRLMGEGVMTVQPAFFGARGVSAPPSGTNLTAEANAWNLVNYVSGDPKEGTTWLYTINGPATIPTAAGTITLLNVAPFNLGGMVAVLKGGSAFALKGKQLLGELMNPAGAPVAPVTLLVAKP